MGIQEMTRKHAIEDVVDAAGLACDLRHAL